jgi:hypothetical protein
MDVCSSAPSGFARLLRVLTADEKLRPAPEDGGEEDISVYVSENMF